MRSVHFRAILAMLSCAVLALPAAAAEIDLVGVFGNKAAVLVIDGVPKTVRIGRSAGGVRVLAVHADRAVIEANGKRRTIMLSRQHVSRGTAAGNKRQSAVLAADSRGHFVVDGAVNGTSMRFLLDTGATLIALPAPDAVRLAIDYLRGTRGTIQTANGPARAYRIKLDSVKVGNIELHNVDALVIEEGLDTALLGMSFLNRVEIEQQGRTMTLRRRY